MADLSTKAQAHADWLANGLSTQQIEDKYSTHKTTVQRWLKQWESEEITTIREKTYFEVFVTGDSLEKHDSLLETLGSELEKIRKHVEKLKVGTPEHTSSLKLMIETGKRYSVLTGIEAMIDRNKAKQVEAGKWEVQQGKLPPSKLNDGPKRPVSGPIIPLNSD